MASKAPVERSKSYGTTTKVALLAAATRILSLTILYLLRSIPSFDSSAKLLDTSKYPLATLRWDTIHFTKIATEGYQYEQLLAFQPGWPLVMRLAGEVKAGMSSSLGMEGGSMVRTVVQGGEVMAILSYIGAAVMFYKLSLALFSPRFAWLCTYFYLLAPTPAVLSSSYTEPLFALTSMAGYYSLIKRRYILASFSLAMATFVRATGIFNVIPMAWIMLISHKDGRQGVILRLILAGITCCIVVLPFLAFQLYAHLSFCPGRPWCYRQLPYSFVQSEYWNIGLFKYWKMEQLPNLLIASPVLIVSLRRPLRSISSTPTAKSTFMGLYIHHILMTLLLIFSSHTQIALRVIASDPVVWWNVTDMAFGNSPDSKMSKSGKAWIWWSVLWGSASLVLWAGYYPPA